MEKKSSRPPVVVVVGHVDHGKTSLLDSIRKTSITKREAGGITQSIGASVATTEAGKEITFIDTPGHALFANMRSRGVNLADIAILVVAADDAVKPQTKEAIQLLQTSQIPFIVAITKIDLPSANIEMVLQSLEKEGVYLEKRGGDTSYVSVSNKTGEGIKELLDLISLIAEMHEIKGDLESELEGFVIETSKDKRGRLASVIIKSGKIKIGDTIFANEILAKIKGLFDDNQKPVKEVQAGYPTQVLGFEELPQVGSKISSKGEDVKSTNIVTKDINSKEVKLKIVIKAKTAGSLEAIITNIPENVQVVRSGVGDVTESDIFFAKAANALIFLFESKFSSTIRKLSETEDVKIQKFDVVYDFIEKLKELIDKDKEEIIGIAQIIASFPFDKRRVAGCKIQEGQIKRTDKLKLIRDKKELGKVRIISLRKQRDEVNIVKQGEECGILFEPQLDFKEGDMLLCSASQV